MKFVRVEADENEVQLVRMDLVAVVRQRVVDGTNSVVDFLGRELRCVGKTSDEEYFYGTITDAIEEI